MTAYVVRRVFYMLITLALVSMVGFAIIQLPPGDFLDTHLRQLGITGAQLSEEELQDIRAYYGLDSPGYMQYFVWVGNMLRGDLGESYSYRIPVGELVGDRLPLTVLVSLLTIVVTFLLAVPIGIYSATHQYSLGDYTATVFGFVGLATPNFMLALLLMWISLSWFGFPITGLFSSEYLDQPWSVAKFLDMMLHLPVAILVVATGGTAGLIRVMRGSLLDELQKQYVITARSKGLQEGTLLFKYPVRIALNPIISGIGGVFPELVSGTVITAIVLNLPTVGPLLFNALTQEDMQLAASIVMVLSLLTIVGIFVSDMLLLWIDPRIRFGSEKATA